MNISLSAPDITEQEKKFVLEVLESNYLSMGPMLERFEKEFASYIGTKHAIAVNSGTSGLHLMVKALGLKSGDEVITTPFSFVASANCLLYEGVRPVFVDIDCQSMNIDTNLIEKAITHRTRAVLPVHVFGVPADMTRIRDIAVKNNLKILEDSCEALGAAHGGKKVGTFGEGAVFAFYPNKQMTTGEGGMIVTDNDTIASACRSMRNQGRDEGSEWLCHDRLGYNYRLDEMSAALGLAQLKRIDEILQKRSRVASLYRDKLGDIKEVQLPLTDHIPNTTLSWFVFVVRLNPLVDRNKVIKYMKDAGIDTRPYFNPIHLQSFYIEQFGYRRGDFPVTETISESTLALPFHNNLTEKQISYVAMALKEAVRKCRKGAENNE